VRRLKAEGQRPKAVPPYDLRERTMAFALRIVKVVDALPRTTAGFVLGKQVCRSGTSVGANVEEAQAAQTKPEFSRKMNIAKAEARETRYWLRVIGGSELIPDSKLGPLIVEADELSRILTAITIRAERNYGRG
jgi:four helix bundle protein